MEDKYNFGEGNKRKRGKNVENEKEKWKRGTRVADKGGWKLSHRVEYLKILSTLCGKV